MTMRFIVDYGIPGYGPDASNDSFTVCETWPEVADDLARRLAESADSEGDSAEGYAESGDYETAWFTRKHADEMYNLADNLNNSRADAPLYRGRPELWAQTIERTVAEHFPYDVHSGLRIYAWESDEFGADEDDPGVIGDSLGTAR
jgi:hypothetical protein